MKIKEILNDIQYVDDFEGDGNDEDCFEDEYYSSSDEDDYM